MKTLKEVFTIIRDGERKRGVEMLYNNHYNKMYAIAFSIVNDRQRSEDIVHNVVYKLLTMEKERLPRGRESVWLYYVIKNETLDILKKERVQSNPIFDDFVIKDKNIEDFVDLDEYYSMLKGLNSTQKEVVTLKVLGGYSHKEIAEIVGKPASTVRWIYGTSIKQLRNMIIGFIPTIAILLISFISSLIYFVTNKNDGSDDFLSGSTLYLVNVLKYNMIAIAIAVACLIVVFIVIFNKIYKKIEKNQKTPTFRHS